MRPEPKHAPAGIKARAAEGEIRRRYRFLTYVFGGGVQVDEHRKPRDSVTPVRGASLRGHLRFWWRLMNPRGCSDLDTLRRQEGEIWGSTEHPSPILIEVVQQPKLAREQVVFSYNNKGRLEPAQGMRELAYGAFPLQPSRERQRNRAPAGVLYDYEDAIFELRVRFPDALRSDVESALRAWGALGGLGGRTRRGFGAVTPVGEGASDQAAILQLIRERSSRPAIPSVPTFGVSALHVSRTSHATATDAWKEALAVLQRVRQGRNHGRNDPSPGSRSPAGRSLWPEPDEIRRLTGSAAPKHATPVVQVRSFPRAAFGLPIVFHFNPGSVNEPGSQGDPSVSPLELRPREHERVASPLVLRPIPSPRGFVAAATVLATRIPDVVLQVGTTSHSVSTQLDTAQASMVPALKGAPGAIQRFIAELTR